MRPSMVGNNYRVRILEVGWPVCAPKGGKPAFQGLGLRTLDMHISPHLPGVSVVFPGVDIWACLDSGHGSDCF